MVSVRTEQADRLWHAAEQDRGGPTEPAAPAARQPTTGVLEVLGYVGSALLLGVRTRRGLASVARARLCRRRLRLLHHSRRRTGGPDLLRRGRRRRADRRGDGPVRGVLRPGWVVAMIFARGFVEDELDVTSSDVMGYAIAGGFALVGVLMVGCGLLLRRHVAWTPASISGFAASLRLMSFDH